ncbi:glycosyltransferase [Paraburkholderia sediminicola]|uniref:MraY family glycosyltransferase n=1 Tax=Paraburkholderia sediminicola TaxID=458836 RepID=UPI0038BD7608
MLNLSIAFICSFLATWLVVSSGALQCRFFLDRDLSGVQKNHAVAVPRVGGAAIVIASTITVALSVFLGTSPTREALLLLCCSIPAFAGGLAEDLTKRVSPRTRLLCALGAALAGCWALGGVATRVDSPIIDDLLRFAPIAIGFTMITVAGLTNAINIIDGLNGLASVVTLLIFASICHVGYEVGDFLVASFALVMIGAIAGFLLWNFPNAQIFLGDGGAYFIGFVMAELLIRLISRHPQVSAWYALVAIYPVFETIFSIYRRRILRGRSVSMPDGLHLHTLIYKRITRRGGTAAKPHQRTRRNSLASVYIWLLSLISIVPATFFWRSPYVLAATALAFMVAYVWLYASIVQLRTPRWLKLANSPALSHSARQTSAIDAGIANRGTVVAESDGASRGSD